jgi:alpha/beta superfamily hydrolase
MALLARPLLHRVLRRLGYDDAHVRFLQAPHASPDKPGGYRWFTERPDDAAVTRDYLEDKLAQMGRIDGLVGFSQGAVVAHWLASLLFADAAERPWVICVSGLPCWHVADDTPPLPLRSLHVFSDVDTVVRAADSQALADRFQDPVVVTHGAGHCFLANGAVVAAMREFIASTDQQ